MYETLLHSPTLESVLMVEETIKRYSQECGKYQLWKKLPKKMMYQTFQVILNYLEQSGKILIDKDGSIIWTFNPARIKELIKERLIVKTRTSKSRFGHFRELPKFTKKDKFKGQFEKR